MQAINEAGASPEFAEFARKNQGKSPMQILAEYGVGGAKGPFAR